MRKKEFTAVHFSFAALEGNEVDHLKLANWWAKVRERDVLDAAGRVAGGGVDAWRDGVGRRCGAGLRRGARRALSERDHAVTDDTDPRLGCCPGYVPGLFVAGGPPEAEGQQ